MPGYNPEVFMLSTLFALLLLPAAASANQAAAEAAIRGLTGCYLVDYNYTETTSLKEGYTPDPRVYDVTDDKSVKEWIYPVDLGPGKIRLQHILFATDLGGNLIEGSQLRHQAEDWEYNAPFLYDFVAPLRWEVKPLDNASGQWTRKITNLDDGLRYQCAAPWNTSGAYAEWSCENYAPIPGREFRDMGRKDYNTLQRLTRILAYGNSWLERQDNTKIIYDNGVKTPLVKEAGKNWYVRLPDSECAPALTFMEPRQAFWTLLQETWDEVFTGDRAFVEKAGTPPRFAKMLAIEAQFRGRDLNNRSVRESARQAILALIQEYRAN